MSDRKILVIDESDSARLFVKKSLSEYCVIEAANKAEGIELTGKECPDLILVDSSFAEEVGKVFYQRLTSESNNDRIPLIVITTDGDSISKEVLKYPFIDGCVTKPFQEIKLKSSVESCIAKCPVESQLLKFKDEVLLKTEKGWSSNSFHPEFSGSELEQLLLKDFSLFLDNIITKGTTLKKHELLAFFVQELLKPEYLSQLSTHIESRYELKEMSLLKASTKVVGLEDILQTLSHRKLNGVISVKSENYMIDIYLHDGMIGFILPRQVDLACSFGQQVFCGDRAFSVEFLECAFKSYSPGDNPFYIDLLNQGDIDVERLKSFIKSFGLEVIRLCFSDSSELTLEYREEFFNESGWSVLNLEMPVPKFLLRLYTLIDEYNSIEKVIKGAGSSFRKVEGLDEKRLDLLSEMHRKIFDNVLPGKSCHDLATICEVNLTELYFGLYTLYHLKVIEVVEEVDCVF